MKLAIVGAGIGGLTAALAVRTRLGDAAEIVVLERAERLEEAGAGLQLSPNATRVLLGLGLGGTLEAIGSAPERIEMRTAAGARLIYISHLGEAAVERWGSPYLHVHRADLQAALLKRLAQAGVEIRTNASLGAVSQDAAGATLLLEDGSVVAADAVVGADGLRSTVRQALFGPDRPRYSGQVAWRALVPSERLPAGLKVAATVWTGLGRHFVHYPLRGGTMINLVAVADAAEPGEESWRAKGDAAALAAAFAGWPSPVPELIRAADATVWRWPIYDRPPLARWSAGRTTLLGDAAHPMPPYMAQGAAQAIEDAAALAARFAEGGEVERTFRRYEADRRDRTARVQAASRRNAQLFHLPAPLSRPMFAAAGLLGLDRLDWLYGGGPA